MTGTTTFGAVIVTGANGGVGSAMVKELSGIGYRIIATDLAPQDCDADFFVQEDLSDFVLDENKREAFARKVRAWLKLHDLPLNGIVNNAAIQVLGSVAELKLRDFEATLRINLTAPLMLAQLFMPELCEARGAIVNIGSIHARLTKPRFISYATSKSALRGLTQAMAVDLGACGVRVNTIEPAALNTQMLKDGFRGHPEAFKKLRDFHPVERIGDPMEVAKIAAFLLGEDCRFMTGSVLSADGAISVRLHDPD